MQRAEGSEDEADSDDEQRFRDKGSRSRRGKVGIRDGLAGAGDEDEFA
jgi:hypothetical protein